jgi:Lrp/AsnC family leucine-responsive transcriptional regulator
VAGRIHELERRGVIRGFRADVDPGALGLAVRAQVRLTLDGSAGPAREREVRRLLTRNPMVRAVHRVSGEDCFVAQVLCRRIEDVSALLAELQATRGVQSSRTAFVLETVLDRGALGPVDAALISE